MIKIFLVLFLLVSLGALRVMQDGAYAGFALGPILLAVAVVLGILATKLVMQRFPSHADKDQ
jgi:hypothetical protein